MKRVVLVAMGLEIIKVIGVSVIMAALLFLSSLGIAERILDVLFSPFYLLFFPEMMASYEHGPHSFGAYLLMFAAGTIANLQPAWILVSWCRQTPKPTFLRLHLN